MHEITAHNVDSIFVILRQIFHNNSANLDGGGLSLGGAGIMTVEDEGCDPAQCDGSMRGNGVCNPSCMTRGCNWFVCFLLLLSAVRSDSLSLASLAGTKVIVAIVFLKLDQMQGCLAIAQRAARWIKTICRQAKDASLTVSVRRVIGASQCVQRPERTSLRALSLTLLF